MYKSSRFNILSGSKQKQAVEGSFCAYSHRVCMQNRLEGFDYCLKHILEDKNAPFKQCTYKSVKTGKGCLNAALKSDKKDGYCLEHARRSLLMRQRAARKKRQKETPETLLEGLDVYTTRSVHHLHEQDNRKTQSIASKALEYASSSDSDAETPVIDQAWRGDGDSDAESIDSEQEDPLKHAGIYTAEEVAQIMKDKLIRLQSLYIDQFKRLQHVMREKRRKFLHTVKREKETLGGLGQYAKDHDSRENLARFNAMKRYHRRFGVEALLHRQSKERRIAASEGSNYRPQPIAKCLHNQLGEKCTSRTLPLSKYCMDQPMPQQPGGYHPGDDVNSPDWCVCLKYREMPSEQERVCCERPADRVTLFPDFQVLNLDEAVLALARLYRQDVLVMDDGADILKSNHHAAYRQFVLWSYGRLGAGNRVVIPSCCVWKIRDKYPDPFGQYTGFRPARLV